MSEAGHVLDAIRVAELKAARRLEEARSEADEALSSARREATVLIAEARLRGREEAQLRFEAEVAAAEEEARSVLAGGDAREDELRGAAQPHRDAAVAALVDLLLAPPLEEGK